MGSIFRLTVLAWLAASTAQAQVASGPFAVKGAGGALCSDYIEVARNSNDPSLGQYVGWANGYLSRLNQTDPATFDILPWQSSRLLYLLLADYCSKNPKVSYGAAVYALSRSLAAQRLTAKSELKEYRIGDINLGLYREVVRRLQQRLNLVMEQSLEVNGELDDATVEVLAAFQSRHGLEPTGVPEEPTLMQLFYPPSGN